MILNKFLLDIEGNTFWMGWNIILGAIPLWLSVRLFEGKQKITPVWMAGCVLFIVFLPNAAYILTDIIHLNKFLERFPFMTAQTIFAVQFILLEVVGYWLFVESYRRFEKFIIQKIHTSHIVLRCVTFFVISVGVSVGRFSRLNSWDIILVPNAVLHTLATIVYGPIILFTIFFTGFLFILYALHECVIVALKSRTF